MFLDRNDEPVPTVKPMVIPENDMETGEEIEVVNNIVAHVCGQVKEPGLYTLPEGSRVKDFIDSAGGPLEEASMDRINLAKIVEDSEQILVPSINDPLSEEEIDEGGNEEKSGKININNATIGELDSLPEIGTVIAQRILEYREENGNFKNIDDIKEVNGIGDKTFEKIKDLITVN